MARPTPRPAGASMATTLMVVALGALLAFVLAATSTAHLNVASRLASSQEARNMAESVLARALERVMADPDFGKPGGPGADEVVEVVSQGGRGTARGRLTFSAAQAAALKIPPSTHNFGNDTSVTGWGGQAVPANAVRLLGTGESNGSVVRMEAVVHRPPFPFVIASAGTVHSDGGLLVAAVRDAADVASGVSRVHPENLQPGHMASNSSDGEAVVLGPDSLVTGNVQAPGGVVLDPGTVVKGEVRSPADATELPVIDVRAFDPQGRPDVRALPAMLAGGSLEGFNRASGNVSVSGDLDLDRAVMYVDGDLTVTGGIGGRGLVVVTGDTTVEGGIRLEADNQSVLLGKGDVTLKGRAKNSSSFQGTVYTEGKFRAEEITLVGAFVANGASSDFEVDNVNLVQVGSLSELDLQVGGGSAPTPPPAPTPDPTPSGTLTRKCNVWRTSSTFATVRVSPVTRGEPIDEAQVVYEVTSPYLNTPSFGNRASAEAALAQAAHAALPTWESAHQSYVEMLEAAQASGDETLIQGAQTGLRNTQACIDYLKDFDEAAATDLSVAWEEGEWLFTASRPPNPGPAPTASPRPAVPMKFDLNEFLSPAATMRVILWRELPD